MMIFHREKNRRLSMKKTLLFCIATLTMAMIPFAVDAHSGSHEGGAKFTKHFHETIFAISEKGEVSFEVLLDEKEYKIGKDMIGIVVHDSHDEDVEGARLDVTVTGIEKSLKATEKGGGLYLVANTGLPKEGKWELKITVKKKKINDSAVFIFPDVLNKKMPAGKYDADETTEKK